jgi:AcrR family transcriptional regulator
MSTHDKPRRYRKRRRAESEQQTRRRITEAAVELHGTVGPANTTVTDIANLAGVSRMTVYNHFPTDLELFQACSSHWASENPFPDPGSWTAEDPAERLRGALLELYPWYRGRQQMLGNVIRDTANLPALAEVMGPLWESYMGALVQALAEGWSDAGVVSGDVTVMLRLAVDFSSWRTLTGSGVRDEDAAILMSRMIACVLSGSR